MKVNSTVGAIVRKLKWSVVPRINERLTVKLQNNKEWTSSRTTGSSHGKCRSCRPVKGRRVPLTPVTFCSRDKIWLRTTVVLLYVVVSADSGCRSGSPRSTFPGIKTSLELRFYHTKSGLNPILFFIFTGDIGTQVRVTFSGYQPVLSSTLLIYSLLRDLGMGTFSGNDGECTIEEYDIRLCKTGEC